MRVLTLAFMLLGLLAATAPAQAQPVRTERIEAELVSMNAWAAPGATAIVAVRQSIQPGWHTYWRNPGDSGGATQLDWTLPEGVTAGDIVWPLPERQRFQTLMNYGYSGEVYLPVPITVPADAAPGSTLRLSALALFMVCSDEMCVPDELTLTLDVRVGEGAPPLGPRHGAAIASVIGNAPQPGGLEATISRDGEALILSVSGGALTTGEVSDAYFFPFDRGGINYAAEQPGERGPAGLTLRLTPGGAVIASGITGPMAGVLATSLGAWEIRAEPGEPLPDTRGGGAITGQSGGGALVFLQAALFALLGGLILNLMPCVFPILAMKAASLSASAHDRTEARRDGLAFLSGVLATFLVLAVALLALRSAGQAIGWGFQLQTPGVIAALSLLMLAVGLNLSGVFDVGAGAQGLAEGETGARLSRLPGGTGAFFTGVLAVVVAAPCTAPFMAFALGAALVMPAPLAVLVFLMLGLGLALPYVAVSLSPGVLKRFPKPGPWMGRLKAVLAFPMYGAALWLAWVFSRQTGAEALALFMAAALGLSFALYLWGWRQHARANGGRALISTLFAGVMLVLALVLTVTAARLPAVGTGATVAESGALPAIAWSPEALAAARAEGRPVLVNFTADWCVTCKVNERTSLAVAGTRQAFERTNAVYMVGDWTLRDAAIARELERHGRSGVPLYLVYAPGADAPRILPQILTPGLVESAIDAAAR